MFECEHCHTSYINEYYYNRHLKTCKVLKRKNECKTPIGMSAFKYYKKWLQSKKCYNSDINTFMSSRMYKSFIKFSKYVVEKQMPDIDIFLDFVLDKQIQPIIWTHSIIYSSYIKILDNDKPIESTKLSIKTLFKLSKILDCEIHEVFEYIHIDELIQLLYSRHLSPWFILNYSKLDILLSNPNISKNQHYVLESFIKPEVWSKKIKDKKHDVILIKKILKELNL